MAGLMPFLSPNKQSQSYNTRNNVLGLETNATRMWANAQPDGRPAKHRSRPLFNAAKFG